MSAPPLTDNPHAYPRGITASIAHQAKTGHGANT